MNGTEMFADEDMKKVYAIRMEKSRHMTTESVFEVLPAVM